MDADNKIMIGIIIFLFIIFLLAFVFEGHKKNKIINIAYTQQPVTTIFYPATGEIKTIFCSGGICTCL